jgi:flagellin-like hook-associated protein FlgL
MEPAMDVAPDTALIEPTQEQAQAVAQAKVVETPSHDIYTDGKTRLIKTADYRFEVEQVKKSTEAIEAIVRKYPAYISATELQLENPILENKMTIKVQSDYFYDLLKEVDGQAKFVNFRTIKTMDVSKEFVDLESRLKTKREVEQRYMEILRKKAGTIEELLNAEQQIGALHEEIEATISRINSLKDQVAYSTINLEFYQTITQELKAEPTWAEKFVEGLKTGLTGILNIVIVLAYLWPLMIVGAVVAVAVRYIKRKKVRAV